MKNIITILLAIISINLYSQNEIEPNNGFSQATLITFDSNWQGKIDESLDIDYYKFNVAEAGIIKLQVINVPSNIDLRGFIYLPDQSEIRRMVTINNGQGYSIEVSTCQIGDHFFIS